ncbi:NADAR domain-containing protein [Gilliamella apicola]
MFYQGNFAKFNQNEHLKKILLSTGNKILVEASPHDII